MERRSDTSPLSTDGGYQVQTSYYDESPTFALLRAIAALKGCATRNLPPAWESFNCEALNRMMRKASSSDQDVTVEVDIKDYTAVVRDGGSITIHETGSSDGMDDT